uniref:Uncharacterized protein n=2 Tax=Cacopsylla melanoneura TaxID=428564 RepID=A0A8D8PWQ8_9HEMI
MDLLGQIIHQWRGLVLLLGQVWYQWRLIARYAVATARFNARPLPVVVQSDLNSFTRLVSLRQSVYDVDGVSTVRIETVCSAVHNVFVRLRCGRTGGLRAGNIWHEEGGAALVQYLLTVLVGHRVHGRSRHQWGRLRVLDRGATVSTLGHLRHVLGHRLSRLRRRAEDIRIDIPGGGRSGRRRLAGGRRRRETRRELGNLVQVEVVEDGRGRSGVGRRVQLGGRYCRGFHVGACVICNVIHYYSFSFCCTMSSVIQQYIAVRFVVDVVLTAFDYAREVDDGLVIGFRISCCHDGHLILFVDNGCRGGSGVVGFVVVIVDLLLVLLFTFLLTTSSYHIVKKGTIKRGVDTIRGGGWVTLL